MSNKTISEDARCKFTALLNSEIYALQSVTDGVFSRRIILGTNPKSSTNEKVFLIGSGENQEVFEITNTSIGGPREWLVIPSPDQQVSFGHALDELIAGKCKYIRNEYWEDQRQYWKLGDPKKEPFRDSSLVNTVTGAYVHPTYSSIFSGRWITL